MHLTFDAQGVGARGGLAGDSVVRLTCVCSRVFVNRLLDDVLGCFHTDGCAVKLPRVGGRWDGHHAAGELHAVIELHGSAT